MESLTDNELLMLLEMTRAITKKLIKEDYEKCIINQHKKLLYKIDQEIKLRENLEGAIYRNINYN